MFDSATSLSALTLRSTLCNAPWSMAPLSSHRLALAATILFMLVGSDLEAQEAGRCLQFDGVQSQHLSSAERSIENAAQLFIENRGQWNPQVRYLMQTPGLNTWITSDGVLYDLYERAIGRPSTMLESNSPETRSGHVVQMRFVEGQKGSRAVGVDAAPGLSHYFLGNDSTKWARGVQRYQSVRVEEIYAGIDAVYYLDNGRPRYDLVVAAGGDPTRIRLEFDGAERLDVGEEGVLRIGTSIGEIEQRGLYAYQEIAGRRLQVECSFVRQTDGSVGFGLGEYDRSHPLVIDPIVWSTLLGGGMDENGIGIAVNRAGNAFVVGHTASTNFPTTTGAYRETYYGGNADIFVTKLSPDGSTLVYSTFLGGTSNDYVNAIALDSNDNAYVTGYTSSIDFPTQSGVFDETFNLGNDVIVAKLSADGSALIYSTFVGGLKDDLGNAISVDREGSAYVVGVTKSADFPTTVGVFDETSNGDEDAFLTKLSPDGRSLVYSTYFGGSDEDEFLSVVLDDLGNSYVAGTTSSVNCPVTPGTYDESFNGLRDYVVVKFNPTGQELLYSTFLGGSSWESGPEIVVDSRGSAWIAADPQSIDYPTTDDAFDRVHISSNPLTCLSKLSHDGKELLYSTFVGRQLNRIEGIAIDLWNNIYITGFTERSDFPTTVGAYDESHNGGNDVFVTKFSEKGAFLYSTFLGGSGSDLPWGIAVDQNADIYVTGYTTSASPQFPRTTGAYSESFSGGRDLFVTKLSIPSLDLLSPNGTERLCAGLESEIRWRSVAVENITIEFSSDGGNTWSSIVDSVPASSGSYIWNVPATLGAEYLVQIRTLNKLPIDLVDQSFADFSVETVAITLHPLSQTVGGGREVTFTAEAPGSLSVQWQTSRDGGVKWTDISGATSTTYSFNASLSDDGTQYRALFNDGSCTNPTSAAMLTVTGSLTLIAPNGGETWCGATKQVIRWSGTGIANVKIELSLNGGTTWSSVEDSIPSIGLYEWDVNPTISTLGRIRISDVGNPNFSDASDGDFTINTISIAAQPSNQNVSLGGVANFSVMATGIPSPTVQWQIRPNGTGNWADIIGATSSVYSFNATAAEHLSHYRAMFDNGECQRASMSAQLTVQGVAGVVDATATDAELSAMIIPNPVGTDLARIEISAPNHRKVYVSIYNGLGREVGEEIEAVRESSGIMSAILDVSRLPVGTYIVLLRSGNRTMSVPMRVTHSASR